MIAVAFIPSKRRLLEEGPTFTSVHLDTWESEHCPILYFGIEYRLAQGPKNAPWTNAAGQIDPQQKKFVVSGLQPATWYSLRMTAHNSAGTSTAEYDFATLTKTGGSRLDTR